MSTPTVEVAIFDTTLRDGAQSLPEAHQFPPGKKWDIADTIARLGVGIIEAGFPATPSDAKEVSEVAKTVGRHTYDVHHWNSGQDQGITYVSPVIAGLSRAHQGDIETTWEAVQYANRPRIHTFISTDNEHMRAKFPRMTPSEVLDRGIQSVQYAKEVSANHPDAQVEFSAEAASTTSPEFLEKVVRHAVAAGADIVNIPDTLGQDNPLAIYSYFLRAIQWVMEENSQATISAHNHNDLGQAVANTNMLVHAACDYAAVNDTNVRIQLETTICGIGERAGNADVFPVVANLFQRIEASQVAVEWSFNPVRAVATAHKVLQYANHEVHRQSPVVGSDILIHRSGIHSDGIIKGGHRIYTPFDPTFWGHAVDAVHEDGRYQGANGRSAIAT